MRLRRARKEQRNNARLKKLKREIVNSTRFQTLSRGLVRLHDTCMLLSLESSLPKDREDHIGGKGYTPMTHCNAFTNLFLCHKR